MATYQALKAEGKWDPNKLQSQFDLIAPGWRTDPIARARLFGDLGVTTFQTPIYGQDQYGNFSTDVRIPYAQEAFGDFFTPEQYRQAEEGRANLQWQAEHADSTLGHIGDFVGGTLKNFVLPAAATYLGVSGLDTLFGAAGGASTGATAAEGTGGGMWDWLDSMEVGDFGAENMFGFEGGGAMMPPAIPEADPTFGGILQQTGPGQFENVANIEKFGALGGLGSLASKVPGLVEKLFGDPIESLGGFSLGEAGFNSAPFLLALSESNRQADDIDDVLRKINGPAYTQSIVNPYDLETGLGRTALLEDQNLRGVRGSSFGQQTLNNYNYMRDLGRGDLMSRATMAPINMELNAINQRNLGRNLLLGAGLDASGRLFSRDPFALKRTS